ncbi:hypothetical protein vBYenSP400_03 [Yersinia phage vB_YenS_P400]|nr:hypothetical protein vBYenSP400_03 [Yersinia phage vB_YenS_P400]
MKKSILVIAMALSISACTTPVSKVCDVASAQVVNGVTDVDNPVNLPVKAFVTDINHNHYIMNIDGLTIESPIMDRNERGNYQKKYNGEIFSIIDKKFYVFKGKSQYLATYNCELVK